ncbi:TIGR00375 family protein [Peribacillus saganii]|uniref:TIGR00375 family protein n=1 Tax=Peribacillus saganii TaxID=2303992 RepID=A0A372LM05_9BACI|nr:endonuclease Q family protein [Peribacillus saganii]RFU67758.1 TIGR00375 family protein [Peribacillus saganii]
MDEYYVDLHIHIGRTKTGRAVKITGSRSLTLSNALTTARERKGLDMIGIIDCHSPEVIEEIMELLETGQLAEKPDGGLQYGDMTFIPGSEIEINDAHCNGPIHVLAYLPTIERMKTFSAWMSGHVKNIHLSSQRIYTNATTLQKAVKSLGGLFIPAHVFTPFKSMYGKGVKQSLNEVFDSDLIDAVELGLSSDTQMAESITELSRYTFLTNSDAHSLGKIAREYQKIEMQASSFSELEKALKMKGGRKVAANYGLNPLLGKYHKTVCANCLTGQDINAAACSHCGSSKIIKGVSERIKELGGDDIERPERPPYIHQVPLEFIPGLGPKLMNRLLDAFGTEMSILHKAEYSELLKVVPEKVAYYIDLARSGKLQIEAGGGGKYGKVKVSDKTL